MVGIKDVAKKAGVSISTVSNVLNKSKYVSPELAKRVEDAVKELQYVANPIARSMKNNRTGIIGVITEDVCGLFYPYVVRGISSVAEEKGYQVMLCDAKASYGDPMALKREYALFQQLFANRVDGIIFVSSISNEESMPYLEKLQKEANMHKRIPFVSLERDFTQAGIDSVYFDGPKNAGMAVQHLIDIGCRKICHITGPRDMAIVQERISGYRNTMSENGLPVKDEMISYADYSHQSGYLAMQELLEKVPDLDGVFSGNDQMAVGALKYLKEAGKKVPEEIKVIGYDDVFLASVVEPSLSTIHIKKRHAGIEAAKMLFTRIEEGEQRQRAARGILMEGSLVIRNSTVAGAPQDWNLIDW